MTYSLVVRDADTGQFGVAVQSHYFSVGSVVPWARPGIGAVATQAMAEITYGPRGLQLMGAGESASTALAALLAEDEGRDTRQVAMIDADGDAAAHTGARCIAEAGHIVGDGWTVEANMMRRAGVPEAMAESLAATAAQPLADRLLAALDAAEAAGGDVRGKQSVAMLIVPGVGEPWARDLELRIEDHVDPLGEMRRLLGLHRAYRGGDPEVMGENYELKFWHLIGLAASGEIDEARSLLKAACEVEPGWRDLAGRLPAAGIVDEDVIAQLLA
ncbi:MAG: hypothetical protein QOG90_1741 [Actinomycetota bacterium]|jgi:uncharacterized Ntn-hydrolase superfamily protein